MMRLRLPEMRGLRPAALALPSGCCPDVEACLASGTLLLEAAGIETARLDAECLAAHALGWPRWQVFLSPRRRLTPEEFGRYLALLGRRERREPLAYVLGMREFWSLSLAVSSGVLVPRPETETLVEATLAVWREMQAENASQEPGARSQEPRAESREGELASPTIMELCTGSGAVAIALATEIPTARILATDVSWRALRVARANALVHAVAGRIAFLRGNLWQAVNGQAPAGSVDLVVANPPYVPTRDVATLMPEVQWEPRLALDGGADGLRVQRDIIATTPERIRPGGFLLLEIGADQAEAILALLGKMGRFETGRIFRDLAGRPRVIAARRARM
ncbi:MAG TPA: peptide chain release factor N(5)-glutamine methyltransferase [Candidatus Methylomirabilis sp.]